LKKFSKILEGLKSKSPLPLLYEHGYTPETIKAEILSDFEPYFTNKANLEKYAINYMVSDWINFMRIGIVYPNIHEEIRIVLESYNKAKSISQEDTIDLLVKLMPFHVESGNRFWSFLNLEVSKSDLEIEEFVQTSLKDISDITEGISKVFYLEQVLMNRIIRGKKFEFEKATQNKLGNLIEELVTTSPFSNLFITKPDNLKLSDWRNISAHHSYYINGDKIVCEYGESDNKKTITISREGLWETVKQCMRTTEILNMAHKLFGFDNMDEIRKAIKTDSKEPRHEMGFLILSSGIMSQGFEILDIDYKDKDEATLVLQDLTDGNPQKRGIHSSQFLVNLWVLTGKPKLTIRYKKANGHLYLNSTCDGETCEMVSSGHKDVSYLAERVEFEIKNGG
jgi:hypothetical protein